MKHKLLVITSGTVAAGIGQELIKQVKTHPASELQLVVRYIDTANLLTRYSGLRSGEWFQMTINPQFMDTVRRNPQNHPELKKLLIQGSCQRYKDQVVEVFVTMLPVPLPSTAEG